MPPGVKLVRWEPLPAPVQVNRWMTVTNTQGFIESTVRQLGARLGVTTGAREIGVVPSWSPVWKPWASP
jgi:hypothetical protein